MGRFSVLALKNELNGIEAFQCRVNCNLERLDHATASDSDRFKAGDAIGVQILFKHRDGQDIFFEVAFVPLHDQRELCYIFAHAPQLLLQLVPAFQVFLELAGLGVGHENHAVGVSQHGDTCLLVEDLAGHSIELKADLIAVNFTKVKWQQIEIQSALRLGIDGDHLSYIVWIDCFVNVMQIRCFATEANAVVDNLTVDLALEPIDKGHCFYSPTRLSVSFSHR